MRKNFPSYAGFLRHFSLITSWNTPACHASDLSAGGTLWSSDVVFSADIEAGKGISAGEGQVFKPKCTY